MCGSNGLSVTQSRTNPFQIQNNPTLFRRNTPFDCFFRFGSDRVHRAQKKVAASNSEIDQRLCTNLFFVTRKVV
jgi:hypothetical protein